MLFLFVQSWAKLCLPDAFSASYYVSLCWGQFNKALQVWEEYHLLVLFVCAHAWTYQCFLSGSVKSVQAEKILLLKVKGRKHGLSCLEDSSFTTQAEGFEPVPPACGKLSDKETQQNSSTTQQTFELWSFSIFSLLTFFEYILKMVLWHCISLKPEI